ncbi:MAG: hypothetical protein U0270_06615 [Labilithrix sp.]
MRQPLLVVLTVIALTGVTGCASDLQNQLCHRGWTVGHPTMTMEGVSIRFSGSTGPDAHVRARSVFGVRSEGAQGDFGAGYATANDRY